jgi:hypothetical protein
MIVSKLNSIIVLLAICFAASLAAQECETALEEALESFAQQNYDRIIVSLTDCPPERLLEKSQKIVAYELLALAYFEKKQADPAKAALHHLLELQPAYAPQPPQYSPEFIKMAKEVKDERARQKGGSILKNKWVWIGGAAAASAAVFFILQKPQVPETLPEAPDPPDSR